MTDSLVGRRVRVTDAFEDFIEFEGDEGVIAEDYDPDENDTGLHLVSVECDNGNRLNFYLRELTIIEEGATP